MDHPHSPYYIGELPGEIASLEMPAGYKCRTGRFRARELASGRVVCPGCKFMCELPRPVAGDQEIWVHKEGQEAKHAA